MKTLAAWIVVIFALGLALGSFVSGSNESTEADLAELGNALDSAPIVDCGEGREALLEPVVVDDRTSFKVRCVPIVEEEEAQEHPVAVIPRSAPVATAPAEPVRAEPSVAVADDTDVDTDESRSWKESAVIIGGSASAGAGIGAIAKGKKGAAVGAALGAATATAYELIKRDNKKKDN